MTEHFNQTDRSICNMRYIRVEKVHLSAVNNKVSLHREYFWGLFLSKVCILEGPHS